MKTILIAVALVVVGCACKEPEIELMPLSLDNMLHDQPSDFYKWFKDCEPGTVFNEGDSITFCPYDWQK